MAVDLAVSRETLRQELELVREYGAGFRWGVIPSFDSLSVLVTMYSCTKELFIVSLVCPDYKELPPFVDFIDPVTGIAGTRRAFPKGTDSLFHSSGPCICAPFNRKAYGTIHNDWNIGDWMNSKANNYDWSSHNTLAGMLALIQTRLINPDYYKGRMG